MGILAELKAFHRAEIEPLCGMARGCNEPEIVQLERDLGEALPAAYREYLLWMGHDNKGPFVGTNAFVDDVLKNNAWLPGLLAENNIAFELPKRYVTFYMHQGYVAGWFHLPTPEPDPLCWLFSEGQTQTPEFRGSFSSFILAEMQSLLPALRQVHGKDPGG